MRNGYNIRDQYAMHFLTFQVVYWIDLFSRQRYRDIILDSFRHCQEEKALRVYAFVVMSNHVHCILSSEGQDLSSTIKDFKTFTSKRIIRSILSEKESRREWILELLKKAAQRHQRNSVYQLWTHENHPMVLISSKFKNQKLNYIHHNPVKAGLVERPEDYLYSSARNYAGIPGLLKVDMIC